MTDVRVSQLLAALLSLAGLSAAVCPGVNVVAVLLFQIFDIYANLRLLRSF